MSPLHRLSSPMNNYKKNTFRRMLYLLKRPEISIAHDTYAKLTYVDESLTIH